MMALIPARGGSKGLPGKNIQPLGGVPLIGWTIAAARQSAQFEWIVVSTDDEAIAQVAREYGAETPFLRPARLATDHATSNEVIAHAMSALGTQGAFALLQPTSPFRNAGHIREAAALLKAGRAQMVLSVAGAKPLSWMLTMDEGGALSQASPNDPAARRQDGGSYALPNGAIYLTTAEAFAQAGGLPRDGLMGLPMGVIDSLDIDTAEDFALAEAVVAAGLRSATEGRA
jgi:CMP-N,N'-diacetyllegionaminic acid synthase